MILITGAAGFFGIHAVKLLLEEGRDVVALGTSGFPEAARSYFGAAGEKHLIFEHCDISDADAVRDVFSRHPIESVIHAAVMTTLGDDEVGLERRMTGVNALGTLYLLEAAREVGVRRFVYVSSSGIYDSYGQGVAPVPETVSVVPGSNGMYRICKIYSEMVCQNFQEHGAFRIAVARIGSPYGPWERPTRSRKGMSLIYRLVELAVRGEEAVIYGRDLTRDWTHMRDIARGCCLLESCTDQDLRHSIYNVTGGAVSSLGRVLEQLTQLCPEFRFRFVEHPSEANIQAAIPWARGPLDISRLKIDCGFTPEFTIDSGLQEYVAWGRTEASWFE
jgi:nucleoside-diphosphate-sugar epimerase